MSRQEKHLYEFGPFRLDPDERLLLRDGNPVSLTPKAFDLLLVLTRNSGHLLEKGELMQAVWPESFVEEGNLTFTMSSLRKALGGNDGRLYIETVPKRGYRFVAGVRVVDDELAGAVVAGTALGRINHADEVTLPREPEQPDSRRPAATNGNGDPAGAAEELAARPDPPAARLDPPAGDLPRPAGRRARGALIAGAVLAALAVGGALLLYGHLRQSGSVVGRSAPFQTMKVTRLTSGVNAARAAISRDGRYVAYAVREAGQQSLWIRQVATNSHVQLVPPAPVEYWAMAFSPDGDYVAYEAGAQGEPSARYQVPVLGGPARKIEPPNPTIGTISPDGQRVFFAKRSPEGKVAVIVANASDAGEEREVAARMVPDALIPAAWSPDGTAIACIAISPTTDGLQRSLVEVRVADGVERPMTSQQWRFIQQVAWLSDGSGLLVGVSDRAYGPYQICYVAYPSGEVQRVTNDTNNYVGLSLTSDDGALVAVKADIDPIVWVVPQGDTSRARQITFGPGTQNDYWGLSLMPDGRIVYESTAGGNQDVWIMDADGGRQQRLTAEGHSNFDPSVSPDGRHIVFASDRGGSTKLWRMDLDGGNPRQLTRGTSSDYLPSWSPDGRWIVYTSSDGRPFSLWKVSVDGGDPVQLTKEKVAAWPVVSPDGTLIACWAVDEQTKRTILHVFPFEGGAPVRVFDTPATANTWAEIRWTSDGKALMYVDTRGGVGNVWVQRLDGGAPSQLTDFKDDRVFRFDWSRDTDTLVCSRGVEANDVVLIRDFRPQ